VPPQNWQFVLPQPPWPLLPPPLLPWPAQIVSWRAGGAWCDYSSLPIAYTLFDCSWGFMFCYLCLPWKNYDCCVLVFVLKSVPLYKISPQPHAARWSWSRASKQIMRSKVWIVCWLPPPLKCWVSLLLAEWTFPRSLVEVLSHCACRWRGPLGWCGARLMPFMYENNFVWCVPRRTQSLAKGWRTSSIGVLSDNHEGFFNGCSVPTTCCNC